MGLSTHVLDTATGRPAAGVDVVAHRHDGDEWTRVGHGTTDDDGRIADLAGGDPRAGTHRLTFDVGAWHAAAEVTGFWPEVAITFVVDDPSGHLHVPLLLSPYGYSTYRGS